jgi:sporulation protein YlmC with PRC-barrel domain
MLLRAKPLIGDHVIASDGEIGRVQDLYFDDLQWKLRYLVVDAGSFWSGRRVLISPDSFREIDWDGKKFHLRLTREQVENSPPVDTDRPVSRQYENLFYAYYGWPVYWGSGGVAAMAAPIPAEDPRPEGNPHLRSLAEVIGYHVEAHDGEIGHVADAVMDEESWSFRYLVIDTSNWWFGKTVVIPPSWAHRISWETSKVHVELTRDAIKNSPEWHADRPVTRAYERQLHAHYERAFYWLDDEEKR